MARHKFDFDVKFQWQILKYTLKDKNGYKALLLYKFDYFDLIQQQVIARAISNFFKLKKRIPASDAVLIEEVKKWFKTKDYATAFTEKDREQVKIKISKLYRGSIKDGDEIIEKCKLFASYVEFKKTLEEVDLDNFSKYEQYSKKIQQAVNIGMQIEEKRGSFIVASHRLRLMERRIKDPVTPTPYRQINNLTNAGGFELGSVVVIVDRPKKGKTAFLVNMAVKYMSQRGKHIIPNRKDGKCKKIIYFDLENGETSINVRVDQCVGGFTKDEVLSGRHDKFLTKKYRKYQRLGGEVFVVRMPANSTTADMQKVMDDLYREYGIRFEVGIIDYVALMGCLSGKTEEFQKISDAYIDVKNWANKNELDLVITGHHVKREGYKRRSSRYDSTDLAKCIDIERHVDAIFGVQQNDIEMKRGILRVEVIAQRDGRGSGRALFYLDIKRQRIREFSEDEVRTYFAQFREDLEKLDDESVDREVIKRKVRESKSDI